MTTQNVSGAENQKQHNLEMMTQILGLDYGADLTDIVDVEFGIDGGVAGVCQRQGYTADIPEVMLAGDVDITEDLRDEIMDDYVVFYDRNAEAACIVYDGESTWVTMDETTWEYIRENGDVIEWAENY